MVNLRLQENKTLSIYSQYELFEGENLADCIKIQMSEKWKNDYDCVLKLLTSRTRLGDTFILNEGADYYIPDFLLTVPQELYVWVEMCKGAIVTKSSAVALKVNTHHEIDNIVTDIQISAFEQVLQNALALNEQTKAIKEEIDVVLDKVQNLPDMDIIQTTINELFKLKEELEEHLEKIDDIPTKMSQLINDVGYITLNDLKENEAITEIVLEAVGDTVVTDGDSVSFDGGFSK